MPTYHNSDIKKLEALPIIGEKPANEKEEKFLREVNEYIFQNLEETGVSLAFSYGDLKNNVSLMLMHGAKYKFPRFLARHIEDVATPIYELRPDNMGGRSPMETGKKPRFQMKQVFSRG